MPRTTKVKCRQCKSSVDKATAFNPSSRQHYCDENCYKKYQKTEEYTQDVLYRNLLQYYDSPSAFMLLKQQVEKAVRENKMKYSGINATLNYYVDILDKQYNPDYGIWQFLSYYEEAREFTKSKLALRKQIKALNETEVENECVYLSGSKRPNKGSLKPMNIEEL